MDALPEELLVEIFSYFNWQELKLLSLVNRRWYRVSGSSVLLKNVSLVLYKVNNARIRKDSFIDDQILVDSMRQYSGVSCSLRFTGDSLIKLALVGSTLMRCVNKWKISRLRIVAQFDLILLFLQRYGNLLTRLVNLSIVLEQFSSSKSYVKNDQDGCILELERLKRFSWIERSLPNNQEPMPYSFVFVVPQLQYMKVHRIEKLKTIENNNIMLSGCTNLKEADINSYDLLNSSLFDAGCSLLEKLTINGFRGASSKLCQKHHILQNLKSIELTGCSQEALDVVSQHAKALKILKLSLLSRWINFDIGLQHLNEMRLESLNLKPSRDTYIKCPNLRKLTVLSVRFESSIRLKAPVLCTLLADQLALRCIELEDELTVDNLGILRPNGVDLESIKFPIYPNVSHLILKLYPMRRGSILKNYQSPNTYTQIKALTILGSPTASIDNLTGLKDKFPFLESVHLHSINPLSFRGFNSDNTRNINFSLKRLIISNSTIDALSQSFPPNIEWIRLYRVRIERSWISGKSSALLPGASCSSLALDQKDDKEQRSFKTADTYSTLGFRFDESDEMLNW